MNDYLSYGDRICLYCEETNGFINSNNSSSQYNELRIFTKQDKFSPDNVSDIQEIIFEVVIQNRYKLYKKFMRNFKEIEANSENLELKIQAEQAKATLLSEENDNALEYRRNLGKIVHYGDVIQLRHMYTKKYIHVNVAKTSSMDQNSMILHLLSHNSKSAQFKIVPRYKVKYEGEPVQFMDLVTFESLKAPAHFFHSSDLYQIDNFFFGAALNLATEQSGFTLIKSASQSTNLKEDNILKGGDYIQIIHKEIDAYIESEGLQKDQKTPDVYLLLRKENKTDSSSCRYSTSANTFWQVELEKFNLSTESAHWSSNFRFRHATNRMYLIVKKDLTVSMTKNPNNPSTVFRLHPQNIDNLKICYEKYFRIEHVLTGTWLHANKDKIFIKFEDLKKCFSTEKSLNNLNWENNELRELTCVYQRLYDDAFVLSKVPAAIVESFNLFSGYLPLIRNLISDRKKEKQVSATQSYNSKFALEEIRDNIYNNGKPNNLRQKHLRNLQIVDLIVELVLLPFYSKIDAAFSEKVYRACYEILHNYMKGPSIKNSLYFAKYINLFESKMLENNDLGHKIIEMIAELLRNNEKVLECINFQDIIPFINTVRVNQNYRYLEYLETFCVCNGEPMVQNQIQIATKWLTEDNRGFFIVDRGQNVQLESDVIYIKSNIDASWMRLHDFLDDRNPLYKQDHKDYFLKQVDLILALCFGKNQYNIDLIINKLNYISWEQCYATINSDLIPYYMKTKFFEIIQTMFIDIGKNYSVIDSPKFNFVFSQIQGDISVAIECMFPSPSEQITIKIFPDLVEWIYDFLEKIQCMVASEIDFNYLIRMVFITINKLLQYGFFDSPSILRICQSLLRLLNGKLDLPFEYDGKKDSSKVRKKMVNEYKTTTRYEDSPETRAIVAAKLAGLEIIESILIYERVSVVSKLISRFKKCVQPNLKVQTKRKPGHTHLIPCLNMSFDASHTFIKSKKAAKKMVLELENLFNSARFIDSDNWKDILLDLAHYQNDMMTQKSLLILYKLYSMKESSFQYTYSTFISTTKQSQDLQEQLCDYIPVLKLMSKSQIGHPDLERIMNMIKEMIKICKIPNSESYNPISQRIIVGYGILDVVMELISQIYRSFEKSQMSYGASFVIGLATDLLRHLAISNPSFQEKLFDYLDVILDLYESSPPAQLADLLNYGLFFNNRLFCTKIKPYQLNKIVLMIAEIARKSPLVGSAFIKLLESLVAVENGEVPLKRNQLIVMKYVMKNFNQIVYVLDSKYMSRVDLLTTYSTSNDAQYFIKIVDLFVSCCQGENQYSQSLCQTIIPLDELLELLTHPNIDIVYKRGLLRYFCQVYLFKTSIVNQEGIIKNLLGSKYCGDILNGIEKSSKLIQGLLERASNFNLMHILKREFLLRPPNEIEFEETVQSHIHYIIFGSAIFMASLCSVFTILGIPPSVELMQKIKSINHITMDIFSNLWKFQLHPSVFFVITDSIIQIIPYTDFTDLEAKAVALQHCKPQIMDTDPRKEIDSLYSEEIELNLKLQTFIFNCSQLMAGQNTVKAQIKVNNKKRYVHLIDQSALPLSLEFQNHLNCFIVNNYSKYDKRRLKLIDILIKQLQISGDIKRYGKRKMKFDKENCVKLIKRLDQDALDLRSLQILRGLIYNEECLLPENWESNILNSSVQEILKSIKHIQNSLNQLDLSSRTQIHMINTCDSVRREAIMLQSSMLMNANVRVQESLLKYFKSANEEVFFSAIKYQLQNAFNDMKDQKLMISQRKGDLDVEKCCYFQDDLRIDNLAPILFQQIAEYKAKYMDHNRTLAINESFLTRQMRQIFSQDKTEFKPNFCSNLLDCCTGRKNTISNTLRNDSKTETFLVKNNAYQEYELKSVVTKASSCSSEKLTVDTIWLKEDTSETSRHEPHQNVKLILQLLSRMCDGQFEGLQNYLRRQPDNRTSVDVVGLVVQFLGNIYANIQPNSIDLTIQAFETIEELIMGNQKNRSVVYNAKVVDYANFILRSDEISERCEMDDVLSLLLVIGRVILALVEENGLEETALANEIKITLDIKAVFKTMGRSLEILEEQKKEKSTNNIVYDVGFFYFLILARLGDLSNGNLLKEVQVTDYQLKAFRYFKKGSASIEILKGDQLQRIHFRLKHKEILRESVKEKVKWEVDRTTPSNKIRSFISWSKLILPDMRFQRKIIGNVLLLLITKQWNSMNYLLTLMSLVINILLLIGVEAPKDGFIGLSGPSPNRSANFDIHTINWKFEYPHFPKVVMGLGISHSVLAFLILITYLITDRPTVRTLVGYFLKIKKRIVSILKREKNDKDSDKIVDNTKSQVSLFSFIRFAYCCISLAMSIGGIFIPYLYVFHLFNVIHNNQLLKGVIASVSKNGRVLIWVMILMVIIMYIFSIFAFCFLRANFNPKDYLFADSLVHTFFTLVRFGVVGDLYQYVVPHSSEMASIHTAFDRFSLILIFQLLFFIFITITGLNIIFGIIVDTFSELRDLKYKTEKDMMETCFICSRASHDFDQSNSNFQHHVSYEHNMWTYLFYFLHLKETKINDYFHLDLYVSHMLKEENYDFFPINCALSLTQETVTHSIIDDICRNVKNIVDNRIDQEREKQRKTNLFKHSQWQKQYQHSHTSSSSNQDISSEETNATQITTNRNSSTIPNQNRTSLDVQSSSQSNFKSPSQTPTVNRSLSNLNQT